MKLRILDNSIRLRLTQSEVDVASHDGAVAGTVKFGGDHRFDYVLCSSPTAEETEAGISHNELTVRVPKATLHQWAASDQVSIACTQGLDDGEELRILIEKDFACLAPRVGEDESDMFPHPESGNKNC